MRANKKNGPANVAATADETFEELAKATNEMANKLAKFWLKEFEENTLSKRIEPERFMQISILAMCKYASVLAVDINMDADHFAAMCRGAHDESYKTAPKFGA